MKIRTQINLAFLAVALGIVIAAAQSVVAHPAIVPTKHEVRTVLKLESLEYRTGQAAFVVPATEKQPLTF